MSKNKSNILFFLVWLIHLICLFFSPIINSRPTGIYLWCIGMALFLFLFRIFRHSPILNIYLLFSFLNLFYLLPYYFFNIPYHYLIENQSLYLTNKTVLIFILFTSILFFRLNLDTKTRQIFFYHHNDKLIYSLSIIILVIMYPISIITNPPSIGIAYTGEITTSIWLEYCIIFFIIGGLYSKSNKRKILLLIISAFYIILPLLYGRRLQSIMIALTIFNLFYAYQFSTKRVLFFSIMTFVGLRSFASIRMGQSMSILSSLLSIDENNIMGNNQGGVIVCSTSYLALIEDGIFDFGFRAKSFLGQFTSILLPYKWNLPEAYINFSALNHTPIPGNGGLISTYLYLWGGLLGVFIGALILRSVLTKPLDNIYNKAIFIFILSTFPRWHSYNLMILFKMTFWLILILGSIKLYARYNLKPNEH